MPSGAQKVRVTVACACLHSYVWPGLCGLCVSAMCGRAAEGLMSIMHMCVCACVCVCVHLGVPVMGRAEVQRGLLRHLDRGRLLRQGGWVWRGTHTHTTRTYTGPTDR
jgi:hypothetical protein